MSLFGDIDATNIPELQTSNPAGTFEFVLTSVRTEVGSKNNPDYNFLVFTFESEDLPFAQKEKKWVPTREQFQSDPKARQAASFLKERLLSLGVPVERLNDVRAEHLEGIRGVMTLYADKDFTRIRTIQVTGPNSPGVGTVNPMPMPAKPDPWSPTSQPDAPAPAPAPAFQAPSFQAPANSPGFQVPNFQMP